ncbi:MAG TPA: Ldh family oxidoreductase [Pyrinomonadaceae bacterium]|jgi:LDH2 family malate/lactate/ureidoglycolate dehydrogenase
MPKFSVEYLLSVTREIIESTGTPVPIARRVAQALINANLAGHESHGIMRLPEYLEQVDQKLIRVDAEPQVVSETPGTAVMDARRGWGHYALDRAMAKAIEKSKTVGIGAVALSGCNHAGRMGEYVEAATAAGCIGMIFAGVGGRQTGCAAPFGGRGHYLGTNPLAIGVPDGGAAPFVLDFATTMAARGKIKVALSRGVPLPEGWILDSDGKAATRPEDFFEGGSLLHFGGHKGYALSLMACLLGGLSGAFQPEHERMGGIFVQAIDVSAFHPLEGYSQNAGRFLSAIKSAPRAEAGQEVMFAGEPEARHRRFCLAQGIELPDSVWNGIIEATVKRGLSLAQESPPS